MLILGYFMRFDCKKDGKNHLLVCISITNAQSINLNSLFCLVPVCILLIIIISKIVDEPVSRAITSDAHLLFPLHQQLSERVLISHIIKQEHKTQSQPLPIYPRKD